MQKTIDQSVYYHLFQRFLKKSSKNKWHCILIIIYLSPYLCGYRKGYSAQHALLTLIEKWKSILDKKGFGGAILMDLSKAFDTLNHELLIAKLHAYGFSSDALVLIKSYLKDKSSYKNYFFFCCCNVALN